ncbi:MAG TPA: right-handed parallel beta-helix repeat-containing protein [Gemmatimonadales bacterium]|nr:right-handed parallel beta-helix repeat-containing protein [Gemmatimonadales bacterium]
MLLSTFFALLSALFASPPAHTYYVAPAPAGAPTGNGSHARPWDLATALAGGGGRIQAGDTIWLTAGRYVGSFRTQLRGAPGRPIVFRQARGARATIDGTLFAQGADLTFWGFEIMQSNPLAGTYGLQAQTNNGRFINLIIHDAGSMGVSFWTPGEDAELYGCIVYHNGTHENQDHGVYVHNERGTKLIADNVFFENLAYGIHAYATSHNPPQQNIHIIGNIAFDNGMISQRYRAKGNIIVGSDVPMSGMQVSDNLLFFPPGLGENLRLGYGAVMNEDVVASGNFIWGGEAALKIGTGAWEKLELLNNTFGGARDVFVAVGAASMPPKTPGNEFYEGTRVPPAPAVFVRPNKYEAGRAFIVVYNFSRRPIVKADVSSVLSPGATYELRSVQDVLGAPLARGTYTGDSISLPMQPTAFVPVRPIGRSTAAPPLTRPAFDVFVLTGGAATPRDSAEAGAAARPRARAVAPARSDRR